MDNLWGNLSALREQAGAAAGAAAATAAAMAERAAAEASLLAEQAAKDVTALSRDAANHLAAAVVIGDGPGEEDGWEGEDEDWGDVDGGAGVGEDADGAGDDLRPMVGGGGPPALPLSTAAVGSGDAASPRPTKPLRQWAYVWARSVIAKTKSISSGR